MMPRPGPLLVPLLLAACADPGGPGEGVEWGAFVGTVSEAVAIAAPDGEEPEGTRVEILSRANGVPAATVMTEGGFDPVRRTAS